MTLQDIKERISELRFQVEELQDDAHKIWVESTDQETDEISSEVENGLENIAYQLSDLEELFGEEQTNE